jgi:hypothetical protein
MLTEICDVLQLWALMQHIREDIAAQVESFEQDPDIKPSNVSWRQESTILPFSSVDWSAGEAAGESTGRGPKVNPGGGVGSVPGWGTSGGAFSGEAGGARGEDAARSLKQRRLSQASGNPGGTVTLGGYAYAKEWDSACKRARWCPSSYDHQDSYFLDIDSDIPLAVQTHLATTSNAVGPVTLLEENLLTISSGSLIAGKLRQGWLDDICRRSVVIGNQFVTCTNYVNRDSWTPILS